MTSYSSAAPAASWRDSALVRVGASAASWFLFALAFTLLFQVSFAVMALGGSCASGGPYEIAVECPEAVAAFAPLSIFGGLIAVGINAVLARGFGTPLTAWAWPILFGGLGSVFLFVFFVSGDLTGLIVGGMFVIMGAVPFLIELTASPQRLLIGPRAADGTRFTEGARARRSMISPSAPNPEGSVRPTALSWLLALALTGAAGYLGYWAGVAWFASVAAG